jgi:hypothetical protein
MWPYTFFVERRDNRCKGGWRWIAGFRSYSDASWSVPDFWKAEDYRITGPAITYTYVEGINHV